MPKSIERCVKKLTPKKENQELGLSVKVVMLRKTRKRNEDN